MVDAFAIMVTSAIALIFWYAISKKTNAVAWVLWAVFVTSMIVTAYPGTKEWLEKSIWPLFR